MVRDATADRKLHMVINKAGFGHQGEFLAVEWARWNDLIGLNMLALTDLSYRLGRHLRDHGERSYLVNSASIGAYQPVPNFAVYAASKASVRDFSEAIAFELGDGKLSVTCVCPGATRTEFADAAGMKLNAMADAAMQSSESCVREALSATFAGRRLVVTGALNKVITFLTRFSLRWLSARLAERSMRPLS